MVKAYKLHKISGISAGFFLLILSISGFFLNHDKWSFLYTTTFSSVPSHILNSQNRLFNGYYRDTSQHIIAGGYRGLYESFNNGETFSQVSNLQILAIIPDKNILYLATSNGIYTYNVGTLKQVALNKHYITALCISNRYLIGVVDKEKLITIDKTNLQTISQKNIHIPTKLLQEDITLSRFVRDLHYGRGLFDGDISLLLNDYGAILLTFLALSGYIIWWLIQRKKHPKISRRLIKLHANFFAIIAIFPLGILALSGLFLDHSSSLAKFMNSIILPHTILPPIYNSLKSDIWSVDFDGNVYRVGNRYGVYKSKDLNTWQLESKGLAYKMIRRGKILYVSGMGAPNRIYKDNKFHFLKNTPHMFRDIIIQGKNIKYFSAMSKGFPLPQFHDVTLYTLLLTLHDGTFFSRWWIWINDLAALALITLCITGLIRWYTKKIKYT